MKSSRYSTSRQKACNLCIRGKTRCDKDPTGCSRCRHRGLLCTYSQVQDTPSSNPINDPELDLQETIPPGPGMLGDHQTLLVRDVSSTARSDRSSPSNRLPASTAGADAPSHSTSEHFDFSALNLVCTINVDDIASRWLNTYVPLPGQVVKDYPPSISNLINRMLKSYAASVVRGHNAPPPFIHFSQINDESSMPLATCLNMVRICQNPIPGSQAAAAEILQQEMSRIYDRRAQCSPMELLASFQAYLIYAMVLFLRLKQASTPFLRQAMINLQDLAWSTTRHGVLCLAEQQHLRPTWEEWIVTEAKRRTLYVMYMFDDVISKQEGIPTFLGVELIGLPAPGSKSLWSADTRRSWQDSYNLHLADWSEGGLRIDELWARPLELSEQDIARRRSRVDQWLEDLDEFGMMIYIVTSCTHGT